MSASDRSTINALTAATTAPVDTGRFYAGPANLAQDVLTVPAGSGLTLDSTLREATQPLAGGWDTAYSGAVATTGSRVFEFKLTGGVAPNSFFIGLADAFTDGNLNPALPGTTNIYGYTSGGTLPGRVAIYVNFDTGAGWIAVDGIYQSGNPETGTSPSFTFTANTPLAAVVSLFDVLTAEFRTADEFIESFIPTNFIAWSGDAQASAPAFRRIVARDIALSVRSVTASQKVLGTDATVLADASSGGMTLTLRAAHKYASRMFNFKKIDDSSSVVTIDADPSKADHLLLDGTAGSFASTPHSAALAPQKENLLARSEELDAAVWVKSGANITPNTATDSLGNLTLDKVEVTNVTSPHILQSPFPGAPLNGVQITAGAEVKAGNITSAGFNLAVNGSGNLIHSDAKIISGPGTITGVGTDLITITGLLTTEVTKVSLTATPNFASGDFVLKIRPAGSPVVGDFIHAGRVQMNRGATLHEYTQTLASRVTEDLEIVARVAADDWTPGVFRTIVAIRNENAVDTTHQLRVDPSGRLSLVWVNPAAPTNFIDRASSVVLGLVDGTYKYIKATLDVDNGAGGHDVKFFTSDDGITYTQLGATVTTAGITCIQNTPSVPLRVGGITNVNGEPWQGKIARVEIRNSIGGPVQAVFDAADGKHLATSFMSSETEETWTINGNAQLIGFSRIDGVQSALLQAPMESLTVQSDGSAWWIIQRTISS